MSLVKHYGKMVRRHLNAVANWEPTSPCAPGDYGLLQGGVFVRHGDLRGALGWTPGVEEEAAGGEVHHQSKGMHTHVTELGTSVGPDGLPLVKAEFVLKVEGKEAMHVQLALASKLRIKDHARVAREILQLHREGKWNKDYVVVLEATKVSSGFILVTQEGKAEYSFDAEVARIEELQLSHPALRLRHAHQHEAMKKWNLVAGATPLLTTAKVERAWIVGPTLFRGIDAPSEPLFYSAADWRANAALLDQQRLGQEAEERWVLRECLASDEDSVD